MNFLLLSSMTGLVISFFNIGFFLIFTNITFVNNFTKD